MANARLVTDLLRGCADHSSHREGRNVLPSGRSLELLAPDFYEAHASRFIERMSTGGWLCLLILPALSGCSAVMLAGGPGYDAGTFAVSGIETGIGGQVEVIRYLRSDGGGLGLGPAIELAGHPTANDSDPLFFGTFELRYRRPSRPGAVSGPYWEAGSGVGVAWSAGVRAVAVPVQAEIGVQRRAGSLLLSVGVRERFLALVGTGAPPWDALSSLQLVVGARLGGVDRRPPSATQSTSAGR
jgi:hypothetical protein